MPLRQVLERSAIADRNARVKIVVLAPPYPCAGTGSMRVVRALESPDRLELCVTYDGFDRL